ncbi:hypothetical protein SAMN02745151_01434 [[Clostridium] propionicum DSM 1682]|uniref:Restriction endonuclease type IV Mrr domain-containing protein n=2 Tax=Anaerotignum propionicum TaxID=28446 RepID=A0A0X1U8Y1_ANAPI|nr:hypothetical protein CPRO_18360 [Anaerotignum propionicum DSM 1682]SHE67975.1 hypothetical protein SAMN02745151_01434 [[Clostridium] propionicum DSM 1682] [Anaerotignum propionicum DSM 1682]
MPILKNMEIPKPQNWQDFERLVESYLRMKWPNCMIALFGSGGQTQHGVDVYLRDKNASFVGVQCKKVERLTYAQIQKEIDKAKDFTPTLTNYIIATSMKKDARLQEKVNILNSQHFEKGLFSIDILFWEDIIALIVSDEKVFAQHYPQLSPDKGRANNCTTVHAANIKDSVIGNNITINTSKNQNIKKTPIQDTIGSNTYMKNYVKHLIDRYHEFKKATENMDRSPMNYALLYNAIKREIGFKWDETPNERFEDLCEFLQRKIDNTILGKKQKSQGIKNYSTYDEFQVKTRGAVRKQT